MRRQFSDLLIKYWLLVDTVGWRLQFTAEEEKLWHQNDTSSTGTTWSFDDMAPACHSYSRHKKLPRKMRWGAEIWLVRARGAERYSWKSSDQTGQQIVIHFSVSCRLVITRRYWFSISCRPVWPSRSAVVVCCVHQSYNEDVCHRSHLVVKSTATNWCLSP